MDVANLSPSPRLAEVGVANLGPAAKTVAAAVASLRAAPETLRPAATLIEVAATKLDRRSGRAGPAAKGNVGVTSKERRAAETRIHEAVARISGAGVLAFATNPAVRAEFAALKPMKNI